MNRRELFKMLGTAAAVTAAGIFVPSTRKIFLPPRAGWTLGTEPGLNVSEVLRPTGWADGTLNVGDIVSFNLGPPGPRKLFIVTRVGGSKRELATFVPYQGVKDARFI
jgi:hypothetical protein